MKVLYHANCLDGFGAAFAIWLARGDEDTDYIPVQYGDPVPDGLQGEQVAIVDFSYSADELINLAKYAAEHVLVIDHHKSAKAELEHLEHPKITTIFDMDKSGAVLAWEQFMPDEEPPKLLRHIQDRDLWQFKLPGTREVTAGLRLYPNFRSWMQFTGCPDLMQTPMGQQGSGIVQFLDLEAAKICTTGPRRWSVTGDVVPIYNLQDFMVSDTLHKALETYPDTPYAVAYFDLPDKRVYSMRSRIGTDVDVSEIAKRYGGGGHKHAAGFTSSGAYRWI